MMSRFMLYDLVWNRDSSRRGATRHLSYFHLANETEVLRDVLAFFLMLRMLLRAPIILHENFSFLAQHLREAWVSMECRLFDTRLKTFHTSDIIDKITMHLDLDVQPLSDETVKEIIGKKLYKSIARLPMPYQKEIVGWFIRPDEKDDIYLVEEVPSSFYRKLVTYEMERHRAVGGD